MSASLLYPDEMEPPVKSLTTILCSSEEPPYVVEDETSKRRYDGAALVIAAIFLVKALVLAFFVTPLWDVPDEVAHYAYIADIVDGRGIPRPGQSWIPAELVSHWWQRPVSPAEPNWVANHPPLYHLVAAPFLMVARVVTEDRALQYRSPRVFSALLGAGSILLLYVAMIEVSSSRRFALICSAALSVLPMFSHMSSGTNHDVALVAASSVALVYWSRLERNGRLADGVRMAVALAFAAGVKLSAVAIAGPLLILSAAAIRRHGRLRWTWLLPCAIAAAPTLVWHVRVGGGASDRVVTAGEVVGTLGFFEYLRSYPVLDHTVRNFVGLIGWTGSGKGHVRWFQISGPYYLAFTVVGIVLTCAAIAWVLCDSRRFGKSGATLIVGWFVITAAAALWLVSTTGAGAGVRSVWYVLLFSTPLFSAALLIAPIRLSGRLIYGAQFVLGVFTAAYLLNAWNAYRFYGELRATHGRYYFALIPFIAVALGYPGFLWWRARWPRSLPLLALIPFALAVAEALFFVLVVGPFYGRIRV
ncbi:MAG TPA: glycosyltransferase family 39 protein [Thermoanaerobaculia bacterium]|nr:glycosyltransferase family 39 protein [Thermoanaerobaculia bacterium]